MNRVPRYQARVLTVPTPEENKQLIQLTQRSAFQSGATVYVDRSPEYTFARRMHDGAAVVVVEDGGRIIAAALFISFSATLGSGATSTKGLYATDVVVDPRHRHRRAFYALLQASHAYARASGAEVVLAICGASNRAINSTMEHPRNPFRWRQTRAFFVAHVMPAMRLWRLSPPVQIAVADLERREALAFIQDHLRQSAFHVPMDAQRLERESAARGDPHAVQVAYVVEEGTVAGAVLYSDSIPYARLVPTALLPTQRALVWLARGLHGLGLHVNPPQVGAPLRSMWVRYLAARTSSARRMLLGHVHQVARVGQYHTVAMTSDDARALSADTPWLTPRSIDANIVWISEQSCQALRADAGFHFDLAAFL